MRALTFMRPLTFPENILTKPRPLTFPENILTKPRNQSAPALQGAADACTIRRKHARRVTTQRQRSMTAPLMTHKLLQAIEKAATVVGSPTPTWSSAG